MTGKERAHIKIESSKKFSTPPGFISCTSFLLRKVVDGSLDIGGDPQKEPVPLNITSNIFGEETFGRSLRSRPWILSDDHNQEEVVSYLCDKVETRPSRDVSNANNLEEAAIFRPSEEEFSNTLAYIESIRLRAEPHGICRIIPPPTWQPPCHLKENNIWEDSTFRTQIQRFADLRNQNFPNKKPKYDKNGPVKRRQASKGMTDDSRCSPIREFNSNCPEPGVELTLEMFKRHADDFKEQHFSMKDNVSRGDNSTTLDKQLQPSVEDIEGEYRWIVENCTEEVKVLYADDTDTRVLGSGFPSMTTSACHVYKESGWNLKNTPRLPGSLLSLEDSKSSSVLVPRLQVGMCFSTHFWKVEEHLLYSLCYMHMGAPKIWYGVPARFSMKCKTIMRNCVPDSLVELNDLQHSVIFIFSIVTTSIPKKYYHFRRSLISSICH